MLPKISVIMPTNNRRMFVRRALEYFYRYTDVDAEMIIVDGGNRHLDEEELGPKVKRILVSAAVSTGEMLNIACEAATAPVIARHDDDDWYARARLIDSLHALEKSPCGFVMGGDLIHYNMFGKAAAIKFAWGGAFMFRKDLWRRIKFPHMITHEDVGFMQLIGQENWRDLPVVPNAKDLYVHVHHNNNIFKRGVYENEPEAKSYMKKIMGRDYEWYEAYAEMQVE